jgi:hypothetical protein
MDHHPQTIGQCRAPADQGGAPAAPGRLSPEPARATAASSVGRSGALEAGSRALGARGLGSALALGQAEDECGDARVRAASAIASWRALLTGAPCARDGTPDGRPGRVGAWWIAPGEAAWRYEPGIKGCSGDRWREVMDLYARWARPTAEEKA